MSLSDNQNCGVKLKKKKMSDTFMGKKLKSISGKRQRSLFEDELTMQRSSHSRQRGFNSTMSINTNLCRRRTRHNKENKSERKTESNRAQERTL